MQGMQINPDVPTIERSLRDALVLSGGISKDNEDKLSALRWSRAARTDKGVSALGQVVALKLMHPPGLLERLRRSLPEQIKIFGFRCELQRMCTVMTLQRPLCQSSGPSSPAPCTRIMLLKAGFLVWATTCEPTCSVFLRKGQSEFTTEGRGIHRCNLSADVAGAAAGK